MSESMSRADELALADLGHKLVDQVALYGLAQEMAKSPKVGDAIERAKKARALLLQDITANIWRNGMPPIEQATKLGSAQKAFERLRTMTAKNDEQALDEVERGERYLLERVEKAMLGETLSSHTRNFLQTVMSRIETTHVDIQELKASLN